MSCSLALVTYWFREAPIRPEWPSHSPWEKKALGNVRGAFFKVSRRLGKEKERCQSRWGRVRSWRHGPLPQWLRALGALRPVPSGDLFPAVSWGFKSRRQSRWSQALTCVADILALPAHPALHTTGHHASNLQAHIRAGVFVIGGRDQGLEHASPTPA